ncbi:putative Lin-54 family protein [Helianthus anomalus]
MKELCSVLVVYANEAARMIADDQRESTDASALKDQMQSQKGPDTEKPVIDGGAQADKTSPDESTSDGSKGRPMSPGTLALMCDEQDTGFTASTSNGLGLGPDGTEAPSQLPNGQVVTETYAAQEKIVLTAFRDCLNKLITLGELKGKFFFFREISYILLNIVLISYVLEKKLVAIIPFKTFKI